MIQGKTISSAGWPVRSATSKLVVILEDVWELVANVGTTMPDAIPGIPKLLDGFCKLVWRAIIYKNKRILQGG